MAINAGSVVWNLDIDDSKFKSKLRSASNDVKSVGDASEASATKGNNAFLTMSKVGMAAVAAAAVTVGAMIVKNIGGAIQRVDTLNNFPKVMSNLGFGAKESTKAIKTLDKGVQGLPTSLDQIASSLMNIAPSAKSLDSATKLTLAFNNALVAGGKSTDLQASAMEQFSQAVAKGKPDMMEWRSIATAMPGQLKQISNSLGYENWQAMAAAVSDGKLSFEKVQDAIVNLNEKGLGKFPSFAEQAKNATGGLGTSITQMNTAIRRGIGKVIQAIGTPEIVKGIGKIGKAFETALTGISSFISKNRGLVNAFATAVAIVGGAFLATAAAIWVFNLALWASPITWIVAGLVALVTGLILLEQKTKIFTTAWNALVNFMKPFLPILQQIGAFIVGQLVEAWRLITVQVGMFMQAIQPIMPILKIIGALLLLVILSPIIAVVSGIIVFIAIITAVITALNWFWNTLAQVANSIASFGRTVVSVTVSIVSQVIGLWNSLTRSVSNAVNSMVNNAVNTVRGFVGSFINAGRDMIDGLIKGIGGGADKVKNVVLDIAKGAEKAIKNFFGIKSPSRMFANMGEMLMAGLAKGIDSGSGIVMNAMDSMNNSLISPTISTNIAPFTDNINSLPTKSVTTVNQYNTVNNNVDMNVVNRQLAWELNRS